MKTLTVMDFLSTYRDILTDGVSVPDYLRPKGNQTFTRVDVIRTCNYGANRWLRYTELPEEANKKSFFKFIALVEIIRSKEGEGVLVCKEALPLVKEIIESDHQHLDEEIYYSSYLLNTGFSVDKDIVIPPTLPSFLQESDTTLGNFMGDFDLARGYLLARYPQSYKVRMSIDGSFKERETIKLFSLKYKPLQELSFGLPPDYEGRDYEVRTTTYLLDKF